MFLYCSFLAHNLSPSHLIGVGAVCGFVERGGLWIAALETKPSIEFLLVPNSNTILYSKCNTATINPCTEAAYKEQKRVLFIALENEIMTEWQSIRWLSTGNSATFSVARNDDSFLSAIA